MADGEKVKTLNQMMSQFSNHLIIDFFLPAYILTPYRKTLKHRNPHHEPNTRASA
jgi:hypothetical protein